MNGNSESDDGFATLYRNYLPRVLNYMRLRVGDEMLAQDLTATTFERAFANIHTLRSADAFAGWLFRIAHNTVAQYYRDRRQTERLDEHLDLVDMAPSPELHATQAAKLREILAGLMALSEREQEIVRLKFIAELKNREIGHIMGLTESNVGVILYRALEKLRSQIGIETRE
jgi:RNA polymerase sigma factor (sigma-70 family)